MASRKEISVILLDVGPLSQGNIKLAAQAVSFHLETKIINKPRDEVALVTFGTTETSNALNAQMAAAEPPDPTQYQYIKTLQQLRPPDLDYLRQLAELNAGQGHSDFIDAVVVALDLLATATLERPLELEKKGVARRITLISNFLSGVREDGIEEIIGGVVGQMQERSIAFDVVSVDVPEEDEAFREPKAANMQYLSRIFSEVNRHSLKQVHHPADLLGVFKVHEFSATAYYSGPLNVGDNMVVRVKVCKKTATVQLPSTEMYSDKSSAADSTHRVTRDSESKSSVDPDIVVAPEERLKAYRYGKQLVPLPGMEEEYLKYQPERGIQFLGCVNREGIPRHHFKKDTWVVVAEKSNDKAGLALSALVRALHKDDKVALLRCCFRSGSEVVLGLATPVVAGLSEPDHLLLNYLPHQEDLRQYAFASFAKHEELHPAHEQLQVAESLIHAMDLTQGGEERLAPEATANPVAQRYLRFMAQRALDPDAAVPESDPLVQRTFLPRFQEMPEAETHLARLSDSFTITSKAQAAVGADVKPEEKLGLLGNADAEFALDTMPSARVETVGTSTPVEDFNAIVKQGDVEAAVSGIQRAVTKLVDNSMGDRFYPKALMCVVALRNESTDQLQAHAASFNTFLRELCSRYEKDKLHTGFWRQLTQQSISLISSDEVSSSPVSAAEAAQFLQEHSGQAAPAVREAAPVADDEEEDELAGME